MIRIISCKLDPISGTLITIWCAYRTWSSAPAVLQFERNHQLIFFVLCNFQPVINGTEAFLSRITDRRNTTRPLFRHLNLKRNSVTTSQAGLMINIAGY